MRQIFPLLISIALGLLAVFAMKNYIQQEKKSNTQQVDMVEVLFSQRHLPAKSVIQKKDVRTAFLPSSSVTSDMVKPHEIIEIQGKSVQREVNRGGPIFHSDFLGHQQKSINELAVGRRLISIAVGQVNGVSGLIKPGKRVDVLYTQNSISALGQAKAKAKDSAGTTLLLENLTVHATDSQTVDIPLAFNQKSRSYSTVTFSVTPTEAALLTSAARHGSITLMLRSNADFNTAEFSSVIGPDNLLQVAKKANALRRQAMQTP